MIKAEPMEHLWIYTSIILAIVVLAKLLSTKTNSVDVLWLIVFGAIRVNIGIVLFPDSLATKKDKDNGLLFNITIMLRKYFGIRKLLTVHSKLF